jgi:hypothetical protein
MVCRPRRTRGTLQGWSGKFEVSNWNTQQQKEIRDALLVLAKYSSGFENAMGPRGQVAPIRHLIATAGGWGANPDKDARYASITPEKNDGTTIYKLNVPANVPGGRLLFDHAL